MYQPMISVCVTLFAVTFTPLANGSIDAAFRQVPAIQELANDDEADAKADDPFEPVREAPLPEGFPEPTPVDEIQIKEYPQYRLARAPMRDAQNQAFWTLFQHITANGIPMTAPVEVTYRRTEDERWAREAVAFLYQFPQQTAEQGDPSVEVVDVPAMTVLSLGVRGEMSPADLKKARAQLDEWLQANRERYQEAGPLRVMGYNSPFVPPADRFFEVEIPIREIR